jgi:hypothetical protein
MRYCEILSPFAIHNLLSMYVDEFGDDVYTGCFSSLTDRGYNNHGTAEHRRIDNQEN